MSDRKRGLLGLGAITAAAVLLGGVVALGGGTAGRAAPESASEHFHGQQFDISDPKEGGRGGEIYLQNCASCHENGVGHAPQRNLFPYMSPQSIYRALTDGAMKAQGQGLSDADKVAVAEFLSTRKITSAAQAAEPPKCQGKAAEFDVADPPAFSGWGLEPSNARFIPGAVADLDKAQVGRLHLKWAVAFPNATQARSQPTPAGGALYIGSHNGGVYALDRATGCARWIFQAGAEVRTAIVVSPWKAGDRDAKPLIYFGDIVGNVYAVDARTGQLAWRVRADAHTGTTMTAAPTLYKDTLYVPVSSLEGVRPADPKFECCTFRGSVAALDAATGKLKWRTYTTKAPELTGLNAAGAKQYGPSGAPVWNSPAIDPRRGQIYFGTGENYSSPAEDHSDAVFALDLATGAVKWVYQATKGDATNLACVSPNKANCPKEDGPDLDFGAAVMLASLPDGRQLVIGGQKAGVVHALDPDTGKLVWKTRVGRGGMLGGVHFGMAAGRSLLYVPINDAPDGHHYDGAPQPGVYALDLATGRKVWAAPADDKACAGAKVCLNGYSQAITAVPGLVFAGSVDGWMRVFDAASGALVWQVDTKAPVKTVNGPEVGGGSFGGGSGPVLYHGVLYASSGYSLAGSHPGNLLLAYDAK
jgi:polyvinyl alcohol dehydrogenase (cytochrome)